MTARDLEDEISMATLDVVRIRELARMANNEAQDEATHTVLHLIHEMAERANTRFCELAIEVRKIEQPAPAKVDRPSKRKGGT